MSKPQCPLCFTALIQKRVTPCMECGGSEMELDNYKEHQYREYELYFSQKLVLCDFCDADFGSYNPKYFGFQKGKKVGYEDFKFIKEITDKKLRIDNYCTTCKHRLPFLEFVAKCREENAIK